MAASKPTHRANSGGPASEDRGYAKRSCFEGRTPPPSCAPHRSKNSKRSLSRSSIAWKARAAASAASSSASKPWFTRMSPPEPDSKNLRSPATVSRTPGESEPASTAAPESSRMSAPTSTTGTPADPAGPRIAQLPSLRMSEVSLSGRPSAPTRPRPMNSRTVMRSYTSPASLGRRSAGGTSIAQSICGR